MVIPIARAPVRPRFVSPETGASLPLEDEVRNWLEEGRPGWLRLVGGPGSGKSTALAHLAAAFGDHPRFEILDERERVAPGASLISQFVVFVGSGRGIPAAVRTLELAPWDRDELIEYLLAEHPKECASVVARLSPDREAGLRGVPELWRIALDQMAVRPSLANPAAALLDFIHTQLPCLEVRRQISGACLQSQSERGGRGPVFLGTHPGGVPKQIILLLRHRPVRLLMAAESRSDKSKSEQEQ
jgi:hypothetical protein